ncbi:hypothetical protein CR159_06375 [Pollutimonas subterranea]|uniref:Uncharacterized protein n=1 Tax=Pollutimonas subterranea TaxID=2045210 RepID=A0A2N4U6I5_9BURK|nr:hypothetical protein [Pollutimonas subterranea]PLC50631.1 hypothetical protein CR159_06375 [Pollutimonas subterranea]
MKTLLVAGLFALLGALLITSLYKPKPLEAQLLHLQVQQSMPEAASEMVREPAEIQALFLVYADDPVLLAKARLALLRYPDMARPIFLMLGESQDFQEVLRRYGEDVTLPIHFFLTHEVFTLELMRGLSETAQSALSAVRRMWNGNETAPATTNGALTAEERGRYAVQFIKAEGYDFLGQFVISPKGDVGWVQTERVLEGINSFFAGGIKGLESKVRRDEAIAMGDVGWAALDVAIGVSALKVLRMGRTTAVGGRSLTFSQRSAALGAGLWRGSVIGARLVKYGAPAVLAYIAIRHPSVINSLLGSAAEKLGLPVGLVQIVGWTLVLLPIMLLLRFVLGPLAWLMAGLVGMLRGLDRLLRRRSLRTAPTS